MIWSDQLLIFVRTGLRNPADLEANRDTSSPELATWHNSATTGKLNHPGVSVSAYDRST